MLAAFDRVLAAQPSALLITVPRHPERFERVAALCAPYGCVRRTAGSAVGERDKVYPGYHGRAAADAGGGRCGLRRRQLVKVGGHNLLEPAALGKPCLSGPAYFNFSDITRQLVAQGGAAVVADAAELAEQVSALLADEGRRREMGEQARAVVLRNRGRWRAPCLTASPARRTTESGVVGIKKRSASRSVLHFRDRLSA